MNILFVTAELAPLVKVGGLADVAGALPKALRALGHDVRVLMPGYSVIDAKRYPRRPVGEPWPVMADKAHTVGLSQGTIPGSDVPLYFLEWPGLFDHVYSSADAGNTLADEMRRFYLFSWAVPAAVNRLGWRPDVVHCQDWHAAMAPLWLEIQPGDPARMVLTIHNFNSQGKWGAAEVFRWLNLRGTEHPLLAARDADGDLNAMQIGIRAADAVTTVSPTYAREILTPEFGERLEDDLNRRANGVTGIINGIDTEVFDPETDRALARQYAAETVTAGKAANKEALQRRLGLGVDPSAPLFVFVGRLTPQKGVALLLPLLPWLRQRGAQVALLGTGHPEIEKVVLAAAAESPSSVSVTAKFDAALGQLLYAGGDFFVMPSLFEPCGLGQLIAMRYGTIPVVRDTGGLHDTVTDLQRSPDLGSGFLFLDPTPEGLRSALDSALNAYGQPERLAAVRRRIMGRDFSWYTSAQEYAKLYARLVNHP